MKMNKSPSAIFIIIIALIFSQVCAGNQDNHDLYTMGSHQDVLRDTQALKSSLLRRGLASATPSPSPSPPPAARAPVVYRVTAYGADPTGKSDSTDAILKAMADAFKGPSQGNLISGINNLGGARIDLEGGSYLISRPLRFPSAGAGNILIHGGTLRASEKFPDNGYLIELSDASSKQPYLYEFVTFRDLFLDSNYRGGGILVSYSLRTIIDNCYVSRFGDTNGVLVEGGHETYITNSFLGQHITAGGDPGERAFSGTAINLMGNDNLVADTVIFSAGTGIVISGQANLISGVHCYNKAFGFGGIGIYLRLPGLTQTRIVNSYMDYTGIVAEDPVQLQISGTFFLGDAYILFKSVKGVVKGINIVDNMFSGSGKGIDIVQLDQKNGAFSNIDQVVVDRNNVNGMAVKSTVGKGSVQGNGTSWTVDFNPDLLFPNLIRHVEYTLLASEAGAFPTHALRNVTGNRVVVESKTPIAASVFVKVDQI